MKNIHIDEGNAPVNFSAKKLKTNLSGGGSCLWVPSSSVVRGPKTITQNGEFTAAAEGKYAYSSINVSRYVNEICGNMNGIPYRVRNINGNLYEDELPTEIRVTTNPQKTAYHDGEYVDYDGIVVKAYKSNGNIWSNTDYPNGIIPYRELILPKQKANSKSMAKCWGNVYKAQGAGGETYEGLSPYEPIHCHTLWRSSISTSYANPEYALTEYYQYESIYNADDTLYLVCFARTYPETIPGDLEQLYRSLGLIYSGPFDAKNPYSSSYNPLPFICIYSKLPFRYNDSYYSKFRREEEKTKDLEDSGSSFHARVGLTEIGSVDNIICRDFDNPEVTHDTKDIYFYPTGTGANIYSIYSADIDGFNERIDTNEILYNEALEKFHTSRNMLNASFMYAIGYILLYGHDYVVEGIGWHRPGDGLLLTTHYPITIT